MNIMKWVIIGIGVLTGGVFFLGPLLENPATTIVLGLVIIIVCAAAYGSGYLTMYLLERKRLYNTHKAILLPWLTMPLLRLILIGMSQDMHFIINFDTPLIFVFASFGGVMAHHATLNKLVA